MRSSPRQQSAYVHATMYHKPTSRSPQQIGEARLQTPLRNPGVGRSCLPTARNASHDQAHQLTRRRQAKLMHPHASTLLGSSDANKRRTGNQYGFRNAIRNLVAESESFLVLLRWISRQGVIVSGLAWLRHPGGGTSPLRRWRMSLVWLWYCQSWSCPASGTMKSLQSA